MRILSIYIIVIDHLLSYFCGVFWKRIVLWYSRLAAYHYCLFQRIFDSKIARNFGADLLSPPKLFSVEVWLSVILPNSTFSCNFRRFYSIDV